MSNFASWDCCDNIQLCLLSFHAKKPITYWQYQLSAAAAVSAAVNTIMYEDV
jgi:hypothetical protein